MTEQPEKYNISQPKNNKALKYNISLLYIKNNQ